MILPLTITKTLKWLSSLPILMQESFWGWWAGKFTCSSVFRTPILTLELWCSRSTSSNSCRHMGRIHTASLSWSCSRFTAGDLTIHVPRTVTCCTIGCCTISSGSVGCVWPLPVHTLLCWGKASCSDPEHGWKKLRTVRKPCNCGLEFLVTCCADKLLRPSPYTSQGSWPTDKWNKHTNMVCHHVCHLLCAHIL